jgi:hypothetical protein
MEELAITTITHGKVGASWRYCAAQRWHSSTNLDLIERRVSPCRQRIRGATILQARGRMDHHRVDAGVVSNFIRGGCFDEAAVGGSGSLPLTGVRGLFDEWLSA